MGTNSCDFEACGGVTARVCCALRDILKIYDMPSRRACCTYKYKSDDVTLNAKSSMHPRYSTWPPH